MTPGPVRSGQCRERDDALPDRETAIFATGIPPVGLGLLVLHTFFVTTTGNSFVMDAWVRNVTVFLFVFPVFGPRFPALATNAAIGLGLFVERVATPRQASPTGIATRRISPS